MTWSDEQKQTIEDASAVVFRFTEASSFVVRDVLVAPHLGDRTIKLAFGTTPG
jgi:hypothetical protein